MMRTKILSNALCAQSNSIGFNKIQGDQKRPSGNVLGKIKVFACVLTPNHAIISISFRSLRITSAE
jgi:hypothetical protein